MLLFADGFDHYPDNANQPLRKWSASRNSGGSNFLGSGRFGAGFNGSERWAYKDLGINAPTLIAGIAVRCTDTSNMDELGFWDAGTCHVGLRINSSTGVVGVYRGAPATNLLGSTVAIPGFALNVFLYYELLATIHDTAGVVIVRVNGVEIINLTGQDTRNGANAYANRVRIGSQADAFSGREFDDFYVLDDVDSGIAGIPNDDFLGDIRVDTIYPNANGNSSQFTGSDGNSTDNYLLVDDTSATDDDTTYVESLTVGQKDTYNMTTPTPTVGTVYGVQVCPLARKTDAGTRTFVPVARSASVEADGDARSLTTSYQYFPDVMEADPSGNAWTLSSLASAEFGIKVDS